MSRRSTPDHIYAARRADPVALTMRPGVPLPLGRLVLAMTLVAACGVAPVANDPVPLPADLAAILEAQSVRLNPADASVPQVSATKALQRARVWLAGDLRLSNVPAQDPSAPDGLIRRLWIEPALGPPRSVWVVAY